MSSARQWYNCSNFACDVLCLEIDFPSTSSCANSKQFCSPFYSWHWAGRPISSTSDGRLRSTHTCGSTHRCFCSAMTWKMMMTLMMVILVMMMAIFSNQPIIVVQLIIAFTQQRPHLVILIPIFWIIAFFVHLLLSLYLPLLLSLSSFSSLIWPAPEPTATPHQLGLDGFCVAGPDIHIHIRTWVIALS